MEFIVCYFLIALESQILYIYSAFVAGWIGASFMQIARKTAKLFTCLGSSTQLRQSIVHTIYSTVISFTNIPGKPQFIELVLDKPQCFYSGCG